MDTGNRSKGDLRLLEPRNLRLRTDAYGRMHLEIGIEERYGPVRAVRCLPLTKPDRFISLQDEEGEEIGIIPEVSQLDGESRRVLEDDLALYYLKARVTAIRKVETKNGIITWELETDLGPKTAHVRDRQNIRPMPDGRIILTDIHDARYEIPVGDALDERSRDWLMIEI